MLIIISKHIVREIDTGGRLGLMRPRGHTKQQSIHKLSVVLHRLMCFSVTSLRSKCLLDLRDLVR